MPFIRLPKNKSKIHWTRHIKEKMKEYQLSERRILKVFKNPERMEEGIVPETVAVMQTAGRRRPYEIWLMYQIRKPKVKNQKSKFKKEKIIMISAWKYPGKSLKGNLPIPKDILDNIHTGE